MLKTSSSTYSPSPPSSNKVPKTLPSYEIPTKIPPLTYTTTLTLPCSESLLNTGTTSYTCLGNITFFTLTTLSKKIMSFNTIPLSSSSMLKKTTSALMLLSLSFSIHETNISLKFTT